MMSDQAVSNSAGPIGDEDANDTLPVTRSTKYCKIHTVVALSWDSESAEAHVFEPTSKAQARFLNRSLWPKLRKSQGFKREIKTDDGRTIFVISDRAETLGKATQGPGLQLDQPLNDKTAKGETPLVEPTTSTPSTHGGDLPVVKSSAIGKLIFQRYLRNCHGDESAPAFQSDGFPPGTEPEAVEEEADQLEKPKQIELPNHDRLDEKLPPEPDNANGAIPTSWEEQSDTGAKRTKPRQVPEKRYLQFVLSLAAEIAGESLDSGADGVCLFGHSFMLEHLYARQMGFLSSQALFEHTDQQRAWTNRIGRTLQHLPGLLKTQEAAAERAWLASLEELRQIFSDEAAGGQQSEEQRPQNIVIMRWIVERSFSGFGPEAVAMLADSFHCHTCDGEPVVKWMLRIRSHARMRRWAGQELLKPSNTSERANPVLMRLIEAHTAHELLLGMKPLLDRMHLVSQEELVYWEWMAEILDGEDMAELESVSNRWEARRSILRSKGLV